MNMNIEFLNDIYQNTKMGMESIDTISKHVDDKQTQEHLYFQHTQYEKYNQEALRLLHQAGCQEKDINAMQKVMSKSMIDVKTMVDSSPAHIAEMMMQGSTMGIADMTKRIKQYQDADQTTLDLANKILKLEEDSLDQWKKYLSLTTV